MKRLVTLLCTMAILASCNCNFEMMTSIAKDGTVTRCFICPADSLLLCGTLPEEIEESVLPIEITDEWILFWSSVSDHERHQWPMTPEEYVACTDTLLLTAERVFSSVKDMSDNFQFDILPVKPSSELERNFRWFFTEFVFSETFPAPEFSVPVTDFLTEEEAFFWFRGKPSQADAASGSVLFEDLCDVAPRVNKWFAANYLAEASKYIADHYNEIPDAPVSKEEFVKGIDSLVKQHAESAGGSEISESWLKDVFYSRYGSDTYFQCIKGMEKPLPSELWSMYMNFSFNYSVVLPGNPIPSDGIKVSGRIQNVSLNPGMIYPGDYTVRFASRSPNVWAWFLTVFLILSVLQFILPRRSK